MFDTSSAGYIYEYIQGQNNFITLHADDLLSIILLDFCGPYNVMQNGQWDLTIFCIISKDKASFIKSSNDRDHLHINTWTGGNVLNSQPA